MPEATTTFTGPAPFKATHEGKITANQRWTLRYEPAGSDAKRSEDGSVDQAVRVSMKFKPGGEAYESSLVEAIGPDALQRSQPYTVVVPSSANSVELWFHDAGEEQGTHHSFDVVS